ncbi:MAG: hypothetical protein JXR34_07070 [Bacteroidales bacterium]|nr:hypothetical protein [Bacteroidales bacterium]
MEKAILSKSTFIKGEQCLKALYLYKNNYSLRDKMPAERVAVFNRGSRVGEIAQGLFPKGINCKIGGPRQYNKAVEKTLECIHSQEKVLYEAAFIAENTIIYLDILTFENEKWHAYEVKSSSKISETYILDAALQYYIIRQSGLEIADFQLIYIDENYVRGEQLEVEKLFQIQDVTEHVQHLYGVIGDKIQQQLNALSKSIMPETPIGIHCRTPYDCDFQGYCWNGIEHIAFEIPALDFEKQWHFFEKQQAGFSESEITDDIVKRQFEHKRRKKDFIQDSLLQVFTEKKEPYIFLNLLTYCPAIPWFKETKPYQTVVYSYYWESVSSDGKILNSSMYLSDMVTDPTFFIVEKLSNELNGHKIISFVDDGILPPAFDILNIIDLKKALIDGNIIGYKLKNYSFDAFVQAFTGRNPWYKKLVVDKQAGLQYEKEFIEKSDLQAIKENISDYHNDKNKYLVKTFFNFLKTYSND